jgi:hypothetical protein
VGLLGFIFLLGRLEQDGRWVAEQAPEEMLEALTAFLAPYRDDG